MQPSIVEKPSASRSQEAGIPGRSDRGAGENSKVGIHRLYNGRLGMTDTKEEFVSKVMNGLNKRKEAKKQARIDFGLYCADRWTRTLRKMAKRTKQGRRS